MTHAQTLVGDKLRRVPVYSRDELRRRRRIDERTIDRRGIEFDCVRGAGIHDAGGRFRQPAPGDAPVKLDPVTLAVMNNRLAAIAEEMGVVLGMTGFSPNIKERHDFSCALFDGRGELVAQAAHIPVHLGSTPLSVRAAIERLEFAPGDVAALNDPFAGGTHLPDLTLVAPIFIGNDKRPFAFAANRAHHADIGGMAPGSMALGDGDLPGRFPAPAGQDGRGRNHLARRADAVPRQHARA